MWHEQLASHGHRITSSRRAVVDALCSARRPLSAHQVLDRAKVYHPSLGLVTVYRTLNLLAELDLVRRVHEDDGCHGYLMSSPGHHHAVICQSCGCATEFSGGDDLSHLLARVRRETGFRVEAHLLQLTGLCSDCQATTQEN